MHGQIVVTDTRLCNYLGMFVNKRCCFSCCKMTNLVCDLDNGWNIVEVIEKYVVPGGCYAVTDIGSRCSKYERRSS